MKMIFAEYGATWLTVIGCFIFKVAWAWWAILIAAAGSLWDVPIGTFFSLVQVVLLLLPAVWMHS